VVTPIHFVTFLLSLYLVDTYYWAQRHKRNNNKNNANGNRRPWFHRLLYRPRSPYDWVDDRSSSQQSTSSTTTRRRKPGVDEIATTRKREKDGPWFYHTKQKKLLKLEAADAFALRNPVLFGLCVLVSCAGWVFWRTVLWLAGWVSSSLFLRAFGG
jgi:hypothetical protein